MKTKLFTLGLLISFVIIQGCEDFRKDDTLVRVKLNIRTQLNNFSNEKVYYWTSYNGTLSEVDPNSQSSRTDITMIIEVTQIEFKKGDIFLRKSGSSNEYDAKLTYYSNPSFSQSSPEEQTIEHIFTWDGNTLSGTK